MVKARRLASLIALYKVLVAAICYTVFVGFESVMVLSSPLRKRKIIVLLGMIVSGFFFLQYQSFRQDHIAIMIEDKLKTEQILVELLDLSISLTAISTFFSFILTAPLSDAG